MYQSAQSVSVSNLSNTILVQSWDRPVLIQSKKLPDHCDYYLSFLEVDYLQDTLSITVIEKLAVHFARHRIPDIPVSDMVHSMTTISSVVSQTWKF